MLWCGLIRGPLGAVKPGIAGRERPTVGGGSRREEPSGVTVFENSDSGPMPTSFVAFTVNV